MQYSIFEFSNEIFENLKILEFENSINLVLPSYHSVSINFPWNVYGFNKSGVSINLLNNKVNREKMKTISIKKYKIKLV